MRPAQFSYFADGDTQAQKFGAANDDDDDELEEESLLETPLDRVEPYQIFKATLLSKPIPILQPAPASSSAKTS